MQDRLYVNNGKGNLTRSNTIPNLKISSGKVLPCDFDHDGDLDLFVAGRMMPGKYPLPATSVVLENNSGVFTNVIDDVAPDLVDLGMVTSGIWADLNGDSWEDLILVGEWMPISIFTNQSGKLVLSESPSLTKTHGWYYSIAAKDMDGDGDLDLVAGNLGRNYKYRASESEPFEVYSGDFDGNGTFDIVLSYYEHGHKYPIRGRSCSSEQIPAIASSFPTFEDFGAADLNDIYGDQLLNSFNLKAYTFSSVLLENKGGNDFGIKPLPNLAQTSSINNILLDDFDQDGKEDILISGNLYQSEIETPRNDAGMGLFLKGDGKNNFTPMSIEESGFFAPHDAKSMEMIEVNKKKHVLVGNNQYFLQLIAVDQEAGGPL